jgi:RNA polymerase sigma-70 factor (ECF subfamily)
VVAADCAQDVLVTVLTRGHTVRHPERFPAWVYGVTKKTLLKHRALGWVRRRAAEEPPEQRDPGRDPHSHAHHAETGARVQRVLDRLPATDREVLLLCDLDGRSASEVAELIGVPVGTVKSRLRMARERFLREARHLALHAPIVEGIHSGGQS